MSILVITISLVACQPATTSPQPPPYSITAEGNTKVYSNYKYGFSFSICNNPDFEFAENYGKAVAAQIGPLLADLKHRIGIYVMVDKVPKNTNLDDYLKAGMKEAENTLTDFAIISEKNTTVSDLQAKLSLYTYTINMNDEDFKFKNTLVAFIKNDTVYGLKYDTPEEFYDQYVECFNLLLSTFKLR